MKLSKQPCNIHLMICLYYCLLYFYTIFPFWLITKIILDPYVGWVLDIFPKTKFFFPNFMPISIIVKYALCHHQLVPIFIKWGYKECKTPNDDSKKTTSIRKHLINFSNSSAVLIEIIVQLECNCWALALLSCIYGSEYCISNIVTRDNYIASNKR